eukprot:2139036-Pleurochrysis_carterae.AAC.1
MAAAMLASKGYSNRNTLQTKGIQMISGFNRKQEPEQRLLIPVKDCFVRTDSNFFSAITQILQHSSIHNFLRQPWCSQLAIR